jgi:hypothetical protein
VEDDEDWVERTIREVEERESLPRPEDELWPDAEGVARNVRDDDDAWEGM